MKEEISNWLEKAEKDLRAAKNSFNSADYEWSAFQCQQSAEKALKALSLKKIKKVRKIHDLVELGKNAAIPEKLLNKLKKLTMAYLYSRYPDVKEDVNLKEKVPEFLNIAEDVVKWVRENL
jgi:HEPN domain-containing protein